MHPRIAIVASAHRPQNWMGLYKSIGQNNVGFELLFVGPNRPEYELPKNFRFIKTSVKPTQCLEIAFRNTTAEYVMNIADDCNFITPRSLDKLCQLYESCNCDKVIISSRMMTDGVDQSHFAHRFFTQEESSLLMPLSGLMSRKFYLELGGIDKNFIAVMWDLDIAMRVYALGGKVVMSDVYMNEDRGKCAGSNLCGEFWEHDRTLLEDLWTANGKVHLKRKKPVDPFLESNILFASQGPRGRWRGKGPVFLDKIGDSLEKLRLMLKKIIRAIKNPSSYFNYMKRMVLRLK